MARPKAKTHVPSRQQPKRTPSIDARRAFGSKSIIVNADIQAFLSTCMGNWSDYSDEEKRGIVASLPPTRPSNAMPGPHSTADITDKPKEGGTTGDPPINYRWLRKDEYVKRAVARFTRDIAAGFYEKSWQDRARKASQERADGKFDEYWRSAVEQMFCPLNDTNHEDDDSSDGEYGRGKVGGARQQKLK